MLAGLNCFCPPATRHYLFPERYEWHAWGNYLAITVMLLSLFPNEGKKHNVVPVNSYWSAQHLSGFRWKYKLSGKHTTSKSRSNEHVSWSVLRPFEPIYRHQEPLQYVSCHTVLSHLQQSRTITCNQQHRFIWVLHQQWCLAATCNASLHACHLTVRGPFASSSELEE